MHFDTAFEFAKLWTGCEHVNACNHSFLAHTWFVEKMWFEPFNFVQEILVCADSFEAKIVNLFLKLIV